MLKDDYSKRNILLYKSTIANKIDNITLNDTLMIFLRVKIHLRIIIELVSPYNIEYFLQMDTVIGEQFSLSYKSIS